jgi:oxygen-dependent protoporphyrinogen oxidase
VAHALDGFGLLVPAVERRRILGALFPSSLFPDRAPQGQVLITSFVGGARQPELARSDEPALLALVRSELRDLLGAEGPESAAFCVRWPKAIPQYTLGYGRIRAALTAAETIHPHFALAGTFRDGISVGDALASGLAAADRLCGPA